MHVWRARRSSKTIYMNVTRTFSWSTTKKEKRTTDTLSDGELWRKLWSVSAPEKRYSEWVRDWRAHCRRPLLLQSSIWKECVLKDGGGRLEKNLLAVTWEERYCHFEVLVRSVRGCLKHTETKRSVCFIIRNWIWTTCTSTSELSLVQHPGSRAFVTLRLEECFVRKEKYKWAC